MRGERSTSVHVFVIASGSSPHARGTRRGRGQERHRIRFIPACAGNATICHLTRPTKTVHPRMRGERLGFMVERGHQGGSSPHARGTLDCVQFGQIFGRFIPACAGNALPVFAFVGRVAVHPRMRGERSMQPPRPTRIIGSSPHARGTRSSQRKTWADWRFIPACAGNAS